MSLCLALALALQEPDLGARLKAGGWKAVEECAARPDLKPELEKLAAGTDADLKWWSGAALAELDARAAMGELYPKPIRLTLEKKDAPAAEIVAEILEKAGVPLETVPDSLGTVTVSFHDRPFLEALDDVCRRSRLSLRPARGGRPGVGLGSGDMVSAPGIYAGLFGWIVESVARTSEATFYEPPTTHLAVCLALRFDPRVVVRGIDTDYVVIAAEDDGGRSLLLAGKQTRSVSRRGGEHRLAYTLSVAPPSAGAKQMALLRGILRLDVGLLGSERSFRRQVYFEARGIPLP
jgi:hypothetical protein